jgi:hypothetical protein
MPIFRAIGLGIVIIILQLTVPSIFAHLQTMIISFLDAGEVSAHIGAQLAGSAGSFSMNHEPLLLPRTPDIIR